MTLHMTAISARLTQLTRYRTRVEIIPPGQKVHLRKGKIGFCDIHLRPGDREYHPQEVQFDDPAHDCNLGTSHSINKLVDVKRSDSRYRTRVEIIPPGQKVHLRKGKIGFCDIHLRWTA
jgi:uncharacterized protein YwbE